MNHWWALELTVNSSYTNDSCGHTTDFYLGKTDLPRANSSKISLGELSTSQVYLGKKSVVRPQLISI